MFFFGPESEKPPPELADEPFFSTPSPNESTIAPQKLFSDAILNGPPDRAAVPVAPQLAPKRGRKTATSSERNGSAARKPSASANRAVSATTMDVDMVNGQVLPLSDARSPSATEPGPDDPGPLMNGTKPDERMDVDEESPLADQPNHEPPLELVPPPTHTLLTGKSTGIQVAPAKVANLAQSTTILNIPGRSNGEHLKSITRITWRPGDRKVVTAMGDDFCGYWDVGTGSSPSITPRYQDLVEPTPAKLTSASAWQPNGDMLAVATYSDQSSDILMFDGQELCMVENLAASQRAITSLLWHRSGSHLFGIAPYGSENKEASATEGSSIVQWNLAGLAGNAEPSTVPVPEILMDMDSAFLDGNGIVCAAGQNAVYCCRTYPVLGVEQRWTSDPNGNDQWTFVRCAWQGGINAMLVSASAETSTLWLPAQNLFRTGAHDAPITGLEFRPRTFAYASKSEFATSSMDGTLKVWRYEEDSSSIISICKVIIGHGSPMMALAYSPDGFCLAGASYDTVRIWNAEHGHNHMATWVDEQNSWNGLKLKDDDMASLGGMSSMNGDATQPSADHTLIWDGDSKRVAFGLGSQVRLGNVHSRKFKANNPRSLSSISNVEGS